MARKFKNYWGSPTMGKVRTSVGENPDMKPGYHIWYLLNINSDIWVISCPLDLKVMRCGHIIYGLKSKFHKSEI
jgi:hypothetical protein